MPRALARLDPTYVPTCAKKRRGGGGFGCGCVYTDEEVVGGDGIGCKKSRHNNAPSLYNHTTTGETGLAKATRCYYISCTRAPIIMYRVWTQISARFQREQCCFAVLLGSRQAEIEHTLSAHELGDAPMKPSLHDNIIL